MYNNTDKTMSYVQYIVSWYYKTTYLYIMITMFKSSRFDTKNFQISTPKIKIPVRNGTAKTAEKTQQSFAVDMLRANLSLNSINFFLLHVTQNDYLSIYLTFLHHCPL